MIDQLALDFRLEPITAPAAPESPLAPVGRFRAFHRENPHIMRAMLHTVAALRQRGVHRYGIAPLFERLRWMYAVQTAGDVYKLNNDFRAFYARALMAIRPDLRGFFNVRRQAVAYAPNVAWLRATTGAHA